MEFEQEKQTVSIRQWTLIQLFLYSGRSLVCLSSSEQLHKLTSRWVLVQKDGCILEQGKAKNMYISYELHKLC